MSRDAPDAAVDRAPGDDRRDGLRRAWERHSLAATIVVGLIALAEQLHLWSAFGSKFLSQDHTIIWYAARDWGQLHLRQPSFYGQNYGGTFEAIPVEVGRVLGIGPLTSLTLFLSLLAVAGWFLLAWAARARGHRLIGLLAVAAPVLLTTSFTALEAFYVAAVGRFLGVLGAAIVLGRGDRRGYLLAGTAVGAFGVVLDYQAALIVVPVLAYALLTAERRTATVRTMAVAIVPAAAWYGFNAWYYAAHPEDAVFKLGVAPSLEILGRSLDISSRWWGLFEPELWRWWIVPCVIGGFAVVVLLWTRRARFVVPTLALVLVWLFALSSPRAEDARELFDLTGLLRRERLILVLPAGLWFLALLVVESGALRRAARWAPVLAGVLLVLVGVSSVERLVTFDSRIEALAAAARAPGVLQVEDEDRVFRQCDEEITAAREAGLSLIVYPETTTLAYACGALGYGRVETLTAIDRRTWLVRAETGDRRDGLLLIGGPEGLCRRTAVRDATTECRRRTSRTPGDQAMTILRFRPETPFRVLRRIGLGLRPATAGCEPELRPGGWRCTG